MLFFSHKVSAILTLVLPFAVFFVMQFGMGDIVSKRNYVESFRIAVVDEDQTIMSKTLIGQIETISLFSEVRSIENFDEELFKEGFAGIITIPKDFFYSVYDMENYPVELVLNSEMPVESEILYSLISSVSDILAADQRAILAEYILEYGELDDSQKDKLYEEAALQVLTDALNRQEIFSIAEQGAEEERITKLSIYSCSLTLLILLVCLQVVKTVPEEMEMGITERFTAAGGKSIYLILSKLFAAVLLLLPSALVLNIVFGLQISGTWILIFLFSVFMSFSVYLLLAVLLKNTAKVQMLCNAFLIFSLLMGGAIYPIQLLPTILRPVSSLTIPFCLNTSIQLLYFEASLSAVIRPFALPLIFALMFTVISALLYQKGRRENV